MPTIASNSPAAGSLAGYFAADHLVVGGPAATIPATLAPGTLPRGAVLGLIATSNIYTLCDPTVSPPDGSQTPVAILANPADPVNDLPATIYPAGQFNAAWLLFHPAWNVVTLRNALQPSGIFLRTASRGFGTPGRG